MRTRLFSVILLLLTVSCNLPFASQATPTSEAPAATSTAEPPTDSATPTVEPTEAGDGTLEAIVILQPGPLSVITSPVAVSGQSRPTFEQNLVVAVYDQDGNEIALQPTTIAADAGSPGPYGSILSFSVASEQPGRISVYEASALDGGIVHLSSVEVTLSPSGPSSIQPAAPGFESIDIQSPAALTELSSGTVVVTGFSDYYFESNLGLMLCGGGGSGAQNDLCGTEDNTLDASFATINSPDIGLPGPFSGEFTFSVSEPTPGRIVVFAASPRDGGLLHVSSIPVLLVP
ncbi:MAG: Gmad2 immunoglobulin-like domain-containing protein [Anaerolineales bacterium]